MANGLSKMGDFYLFGVRQGVQMEKEAAQWTLDITHAIELQVLCRMSSFSQHLQSLLSICRILSFHELANFGCGRNLVLLHAPVNFVEDQISLGISDFFGCFLPSWRSYWRSCSSWPFGFGFPVSDNHIFDTVCKCYAMFPSCMIMREWNVQVLNPFLLFSFLLSDLPYFSSACTSRVNFSDLLCFFYLLSRENIFVPMHSRHVIFLSSEINIIWFSHYKKYRIPLLLFHHFLR